MRTAGTTLAVLVALAGCGDPPMMPEPDGGEETFGVASTAQIVAWEGQERFVTVLRAQSGESLDGATVEVSDTAGALQIREQRCAGDRCAVVLRVLDRVANTGEAIPPPIAGRDAYLVVRIPGASPQRALLRIMPLDTITGGGTEPLAVGGVRLASSADMAATAAFAGRPGGEPIRWVIFGDARLGGTIDVSAEGAMAGPGGYGGGEPAADGNGPGGGGAGIGGAGGGGGGYGTAGEAGAGADDAPGAGGAAGPIDGASGCALDFFADFACGGGGGGGAEGTGGGGGGALAIVALGALDLRSATLRSTGGAGASGGGGGGGGVIAIAAASLEAPAAIEVAGGAGDGRGGAGGRGVVHVQLPGDAPDGAQAGPAVDLASVPAITEAASITLAGRAAPDSLIAVEILDGASFDTVADPGGAFSVEVALGPGLNRLRVVQDGAVRSWVGTSIELESMSAGDARPTGALIDVARLP